MLKILGAVMVISASTLFGFFNERKLYKRVMVLNDIYSFSICIKSDFEYRAPFLYECFENRGLLFGNAANLMKQHDLLPKDALVQSAEELKELNDGDRESVFSFANNLSAENVESQIANISHFISLIEKKINDAEAELKTKGRLYKSAGILTGIGIVILLL